MDLWVLYYLDLQYFLFHLSDLLVLVDLWDLEDQYFLVVLYYQLHLFVLFHLHFPAHLFVLFELQDLVDQSHLSDLLVLVDL